ncbi:spore germination protein [Paenibacillus montanisoli]|uniref:Spore germination protein n=1 Tax=Paenibacillus montanisoli TaxID=2081970 RepID=A0A328U2W1_9BACL|nr:spore germination protein [Paenibacillus montanisoli]RAP77030.1 spore germination protein [Paenibacillus montanisoli]
MEFGGSLSHVESRIFKYLIKKRKIKQTENLKEQSYRDHSEPQELYQSLEQNSDRLRAIYANCSDVIFHAFTIGENKKALLMYIEGLSDSKGIEDFVLTPILRERIGESSEDLQSVKHKLLVPQLKDFNTFLKCIEYLSNGYSILLLDNETQGVAIGLTRWEKRTIEEPSAESGIRGPREGFTETIRTNTSQLRRIIKSPHLKMESMIIGEYTQTNVVIAYIEGIADMALVEKVKNRLQSIEIDGILESGYIEEMIHDFPFSPFPQLLSTERPDVTCGNLLEGRFAILTEGTPFVLIAPITFAALMQSQEDYYQGFMISSFIRWLRYTFSGISLFLPSLYVAILTFHQEMLPGSLLLSMASAREVVPFPALVEALMMEISFEALREAGVRLPKQIGSAVSIVGALVIGQAAVQAGLISTPMVIVVALGGISSLMIPRYPVGISVRMLRFPMMILAGMFGLLGIMMGFIGIVLHLCHIHSFGVPYVSSLATTEGRQLRDVLFKAPLWMMDTRPTLTGGNNHIRQAPNQKPEAGREDEG